MEVSSQQNSRKDMVDHNNIINHLDLIVSIEDFIQEQQSACSLK